MCNQVVCVGGMSVRGRLVMGGREKEDEREEVGARQEEVGREG